jgi:hypothetical protein
MDYSTPKEDRIVELDGPPKVVYTTHNGLWAKLGSVLWEGTILVLIYVLFTSQTLQTWTSQWIPQWESMALISHLVYAIVFALTFMAVRKLFS